ncbi:MAG: signal peptidase [Planctomycetes bacterium]|nr:signal peptidase [Planctomycetota bacterium]
MNEQENVSEADPKVSQKAETSGGGRDRGKKMLVRYGKMSFLGQFRHNERDIPAGSTHVVVQTDRGMEIGEIVSTFCHSRGSCTLSNDKMEDYFQECGPNYPFYRDGRFVRFATEQDLNEQRHLDLDAREKMRHCDKMIQEYKLPMRLVLAEHLFGGDRIIYYFTADGRVDFRELVKRLAREYQTRIEMRQIGARDEARLIADFETCGRECCCKSFLKVLLPVNMRMAKLQKATLDPSKISGRCGRLKCCLRYEDQVYNELNRNLPNLNSWVRIEQGLGQVIEKQVLTHLVKLRLENGRYVAVAVEEILERNCPSPAPPGDVPQREERRRPEVAPKQELEQEVQPDGQEEPADKPKKRRRRRRKKKKNVGDESGGGARDGSQNRSRGNGSGGGSDQSSSDGSK